MNFSGPSFAYAYFAANTGPLLSQEEKKAIFNAVFSREDDLCISDLIRRLIAAFEPSQHPLGFYVSTEASGKKEGARPLLRVYINWLHQLMTHIAGQLRHRQVLEVSRDDVQQVSGFPSDARVFISKRQAENVAVNDNDDDVNLSFAHYSLVLDVGTDLLRKTRIDHKTGRLKMKFAGGETVRAHYALSPIVRLNAAMVRFMAKEQFPRQGDGFLF
ncbi:hypothetical protein TYRP_020779 [Tyrophagus putrescentiae]|nr:hypothetical protein TYRP_020779 [Tyrophagus putrescentiae]